MPRIPKLINRIMGNTPRDVMKEAVSKMHNDVYGLRQASKVYGIPVTTLQRYLLKFKKPEATNLARATSFNKTTVKEFFNNVVSVYKKFENSKLGPHIIYNLDETRLTSVHNTPNVLFHKGMKQVGQVISGERGILITVCCFINAIGNMVPPFMIFPRVNFKPYMLNGSPAKTAGTTTKSGWINGPIFLDVLKHFANHELREKTPQLSTSKESFGSNEADSPLDNFKKLADWEIRERTSKPSTSKGNCQSPKRKFISPFVIRPLQKAGKRKTTNKRRKKS
ncbi:hypothetical protein ILUMI_24481 [Ignelater luminosus]|uniref:HTH psq-type domain-containing protein n=1 Tax=Ignelater luminosus TaxID=2038154 RepID=A0A8K0G0Y6_IGNLU|nr:hypothetical protein ILUMI_24481 [Ignelater luminosus]